ncbi:MAG: hypothetical protein J6D23_01650 [Clostridia bacterium]|nr:hypothetical protein [Clostridia bacterium]
MMGESFKRFKKKYVLDAVIKAILTGICAVLLVVATFLIVTTLKKLDFNMVYAVLTGVAFGLLLGLGTFFVLKPNDKKLAKKLDNTYGLREKIQTMHAFLDDDGDIKLLQREDAIKILDSKPTNMLGLLKGLVAFFVALVICAAYLVTAIVVAFKSEENTPTHDPGDDTQQGGEDDEDEEFTPTDHQRIALEALIQEVEKSNMQADVKANVLSELNVLLSELDNLRMQSQMKEYVVGVIKAVRAHVNGASSTFKVHMLAKDNSNSSIKKLSLALYSLNMSVIETEFVSISSGLFVLGGSKDDIADFNDELGAIIRNSGLGEEDGLYGVLKALNDSLTLIVERTYTDENILSKIDEAFNRTAIGELKKIIPQEKVNNDVKDRVVSELMRIFGITEDDIKEKTDENDDFETTEPEDRPEVGEDGGYGAGGNIFGSDDIVIDKDKEPAGNVDNINVQYGEVIANYESKITEMLRNGEISEELAEILRKYYSVLITPQGGQN